MSTRPKTRRKRPRQWRQINFPKRGIYRLSPNPRRPIRQRAVELWDRVRASIRSTLFWVAVAAIFVAIGWRYLAPLALVIAVAVFLFRPHLKPLVLRIDDDFSTDSAEFLSTLAGVSGVPLLGGNSVRILNNGDEFYPAILEAVRGAQFSITMEQYIFATSTISREFAEACAERARAGVSVKLLVDAVGSGSLSAEIVRLLRSAGCELRWFHPIRWYNLHRVNNRTHRKSIIIDGQIAFTGGAGLDDHWRGNARNPNEWRDLQVRLEGPAVTPLQTGFALNWLLTTGEVLTGPRYYPVMDSEGGVEVQTVLSSPKGDLYAASVLHQLAICCARQCIYITNPYFVPSNQTIALLEEAAARGVDIKVIVAGAHSDSWWARMNSVRLYGALLDAGVEIYEYQPSMLHQKTMIVDRIWATVGTANFDDRSFLLNEESNVCFYDPDLVEQLRQIFFEDLARSHRVEAASWRRRGIRHRLGEMAASLLQDQV
ncbi:MAG: phospholipase D-like domain-containing protein [Bryobacteraceae bacterium]|nr:phospholipase D-like domain-containing protein [Bryobacteraceae bacterium]MDW8378339.1 phospholipase D-like domain-containing protein [Bryobacterales bacterium]